MIRCVGGGGGGGGVGSAPRCVGGGCSPSHAEGENFHSYKYINFCCAGMFDL